MAETFGVKKKGRPDKPSALGISRTDRDGKPIRNVILQVIPNREYISLRPHLEFVELAQQRILHEPGEKIEFAYFLNAGMASLVVLTRDGRSVEVAIVGKEGVVGTPLAVGMDRDPYRAPSFKYLAAASESNPNCLKRRCAMLRNGS